MEMESLIVEDKLFIYECHAEALNITYIQDVMIKEFDFAMFQGGF